MENILTKSSAKIVMNEEKSKDFLRYIKKLNIIEDYKDLIILSANHHFFYDCNELNGVKLIINIKKLNNIPNLNDFMTALLDNISKNTFFCGSFIDNKFSFTSKKNNKVSLLLNAFLIVADYPKKNRLLSIKNVYSIFKAHDFEIIDMTEINDVIYFTSKKI